MLVNSDKNLTLGSLVSGVECKELGSCHSDLTMHTILNRPESTQFFLDPYKREDPGKTTACKIEETSEYRKLRLTVLCVDLYLLPKAIIQETILVFIF